LLQRHLTAFLATIYALLSLTCLTWSADPFVRTLKHTFFYLLSPATLPPLHLMNQWDVFGENMSRFIRIDQNYRKLEAKWQLHRLDEKRMEELERENQRLSRLVGLVPPPAHLPVVARIVLRDPQAWFQGFLINRGRADRIRVSDPVVALQDDREVFVGQISEVFERTSRVLLLTDPLSAVSARLDRTEEEGVVEGEGSHRLVMNYLYPDADVQPGDEVVTAGLGRVIPPGIALGVVSHLEEVSRESFKRAILRPAVRLSRLEDVVVLIRKEEGP
jgi:rod shape-determining protein MreC